MQKRDEPTFYRFTYKYVGQEPTITLLRGILLSVRTSQNKKRKKMKMKIPLGIINISTNLEFNFLIPRIFNLLFFP
jgi:hypothetical protein